MFAGSNDRSDVQGGAKVLFADSGLWKSICVFVFSCDHLIYTYVFQFL